MSVRRFTSTLSCRAVRPCIRAFRPDWSARSNNFTWSAFLKAIRKSWRYDWQAKVALDGWMPITSNFFIFFLFRNSKFVSRTLLAARIWFSLEVLYWPTSWKTKNPSGCRGRNTTSAVFACLTSSSIVHNVQNKEKRKRKHGVPPSVRYPSRRSCLLLIRCPFDSFFFFSFFNSHFCSCCWIHIPALWEFFQLLLLANCLNTN